MGAEPATLTLSPALPLPRSDTFQYLFVNSTTGNSTVNSYNTFYVCMTPRCNVMQARF